MLQYYDQYQIANGVFYTFSENRTKRSLTIKHTQKKIDSLKKKFPYFKYETTTKENFVLLNLYINYTLSPSSVQDVIKHLLELDFNEEPIKFKKSITSYKERLVKDITFLRDNFGKPNLTQLFNSYRKHNIEFYTLWFYLIYSNYDLYTEFDSNVFTRTQIRDLQKIKNLLLYVTFSEKSLEHIKVLFKETDLLN